MVPIHPGRILRRELNARRLSANALARALRVPSGRIVDILNGKRSVTAETALRLGRYFGNAPQFWINLEAQYDLAVAMRDVGRLVEREVQTAAWSGGSSQICRLERVAGCGIIGVRRKSFAYLHRPWRAYPSPVARIERSEIRERSTRSLRR